MPFESTCTPSVASRFPLCIQYEITKFIYLSLVSDLIRRDHGISGPKILTQQKHCCTCNYGKAQILILSVSQTKELITDTRNRDQVFLATTL